VTSTGLTVAHGLGSTPAGFLGFVMDQAGVGAMMLEGQGKNATNIFFIANTPSFQPPNTATTPIAWMAWA
jgi:hypothetical protein